MPGALHQRSAERVFERQRSRSRCYHHTVHDIVERVHTDTECCYHHTVHDIVERVDTDTECYHTVHEIAERVEVLQPP